MDQSITRQSLKRLTGFIISLLVCASAWAHAGDRPNFSGDWQLDTAKSQGLEGETVTLKITDDSGKITYQRSLKKRDGKQYQAHFTCSPGAGECEFNENGHKAKVSLWYDGSALMILKTGGPREDATTERKFELSPDGNTLKVQFTNLNVDNNTKPETWVFLKQPTSIAAKQ